MANTFQAYFIQVITNMHVGSGDANYGIVDKLVQRDPVTGHPTIHASSLKGALREHFESKWGKDDSKVDTIFGKEAKGENESETGAYKFLGADLVALPVRCNFEQYVLGLNSEVANAINSKSLLLTGKEIFDTIDSGNKLFYQVNQPGYPVYAEDVELSAKAAHTNPLKVTSGLNVFATKYATFSNHGFANISRNLPVIARNNIENGKSNNLWYEEIVPHQTVFITFIFTTDIYQKEFEEVLTGDIIQIGGNASIGYGLCKFYKINFAS
ncbi:MAG: type III-B CRISPR module RAMP protein Cmr4 [Chitinophagales bacterium]|nr:type III-B CRISPR module RAMP protein Cmr4 [Chitinophagales bacterium]